MPEVKIKGRTTVKVDYGAPLDVAIRKAGVWGISRSVKYGRLRDVMDDSHIFPQYACVEVEGKGYVNALEFRVKEDLTVILHLKPSLGSALSGRLPLLGAGFQNMRPIRGGLGWKLARSLILSSANLPSHTSSVHIPTEIRHASADILVVGGGPAGLGLAEALSKKGLSYMLVEQHKQLGGRLRNVGNVGELTGSFGLDLEGVRKTVSEHVKGVFLGLYDEDGVGLVSGENWLTKINFKTLVYAPGSRPTPPLFAGNDTPGVVSVDYALHLDRYGLLESPIVFYVEDTWGLAVHGALSRRIETVLVSPLNVEGKVATRIMRVKRSGGMLDVALEGGIRVEAKLVVYSTIRQPSLELPAQAGFRFKPDREKVVCLDSLEDKWAKNGSVWLIGSATGLYELGDAYNHGRALGYLLAGDNASATKLAPNPPPLQQLSNIAKGDPSRFDQDAFVCFCEDVKVDDFIRASQRGLRGVEKTKRFTGWGTGVCQGKMCLANGLRIIGDSPYTQRLPVQPTPLVWLAALGEGLEP